MPGYKAIARANAEAARRQKLRTEGVPSRLLQLEKVNKWREAFKLTPFKPDWTVGSKRKWEAKYKYEKQLYDYNASMRNRRLAGFAAEQRKRVRKTKTQARAFGPSSPTSGAASTGGNLSTYKRYGKTSLIQRALQTGNAPQSGISVPK